MNDPVVLATNWSLMSPGYVELILSCGHKRHSWAGHAPAFDISKLVGLPAVCTACPQPRAAPEVSYEPAVPLSTPKKEEPEARRRTAGATREEMNRIFAQKDRVHSYAEWTEAAWMMSGAPFQRPQPRRLPSLGRIEKDRKAAFGS